MLSTMFLTLEAAADLLQPTFMSYIVDRGIKNADVDQILHYGLIMLCIAAVGAAGALMRNYFSVRTSQTVALELRRDMYRSVQRLSLENIDVLQPAGIITRITNDVTQIQEFINSMMRMMVKAPITCIGAVALIIMQTPRQAPVLIVILIIVGFLILGNVKIGYPRFGRVQKKLDALNAAAREFLSSVRVVKAFNAEEAEEKKFNAASGELAAANTSALHANALFNPLINLAVNMGIVVLLSVVLPAPEGPTMTQSSPSSISRLTPDSAFMVTSPLWYSLVTFLSDRYAILFSHLLKPYTTILPHKPR